jgi:hypothetical protein
VLLCVVAPMFALNLTDTIPLLLLVIRATRPDDIHELLPIDLEVQRGHV